MDIVDLLVVVVGLLSVWPPFAQGIAGPMHELVTSSPKFEVV